MAPGTSSNLSNYHKRRQAKFRTPSSLKPFELNDIADCRRNGVPWKAITARYNINYGSIRFLREIIGRHTGAKFVQRGKRLNDGTTSIPKAVAVTPTLTENMGAQSSFIEYDAKKLKRRGYSMTQIATLLRRPYREIEKLLETL